MSGSTIHASQAVVLCAHGISVAPILREVCWKGPYIAVRHSWWLFGVSLKYMLLLVALPTCLEGALLVWRCRVGFLLIGYGRVAATPAATSPMIAVAARGLIISLLLLLLPLLRAPGLCLSLFCLSLVHICSSLSDIYVGGVTDALLGWHLHSGE